MSNKRFRTPPKEWAEEKKAAAEKLSVEDDNQRRLEKIKLFLEKVLEHTQRAIEQVVAMEAPAHGSIGNRNFYIERKSRLVAMFARIGITACRTMLQALRKDGTDTRELEQTIVGIANKLKGQLPVKAIASTG